MHNTLHASRTKVLAGEEDGMVVILYITLVPLLLQEGPLAHPLQALGRVPQLDKTHGLSPKQRRDISIPLRITVCDVNKAEAVKSTTHVYLQKHNDTVGHTVILVNTRFSAQEGEDRRDLQALTCGYLH